MGYRDDMIKVLDSLYKQMYDELKSALYYEILAYQIPVCENEFMSISRQEITHFFRDWSFINQYSGLPGNAFPISFSVKELKLNYNLQRDRAKIELSNQVPDEIRDSEFYYRTAIMLNHIYEMLNIEGLKTWANKFLITSKEEREHAEILKECMRKL